MKRWLAGLVSPLPAVAAAQGENVVLVGPLQQEGAAVDMNPSGMLLAWKGGTWQTAKRVSTPWPARWQAFTLGQARWGRRCGQRL